METVINYTLTRSQRKTVALYVRNGQIEVRAPLQMPQRDIDHFVAAKAKWLTEKLALSQQMSERRDAFSLDYGDVILYRGQEYPIVAQNGNRVGFNDAAFYMPPNLPPTAIKAACVQIYRLLAKRDLTAKTLDFSGQMAVSPANIKINGARTRWGSCSARKNINYSWRLVMADDDVIDYVVVHELAHLTEMNHSQRFWSIVEDVLPDYRERQERLKQLQRKLSGENWE